jgi:hypothetical protein
MLSERLSQTEQELVAAICADLDGLPYAEKAPVIAASLEAMRKRSPRHVGARKFSPAAPQSARRPVLHLA